MEALYVAVILALTDLRYLVSFPRYGRLKKKCWYKQICNGTYWLLLTGHFRPVFIRPSQWSITAVDFDHCDYDFDHYDDYNHDDYAQDDGDLR